MRFLFSPVIQFMNLFPYRYKFIIVSTVFIIPLLLLSGTTLYILQKDLDETERKNKALNEIRLQQSLYQELINYRDLRFIAGFIEAENRGQIDTLIANSRKSISTQLTAISLIQRPYDLDGSIQASVENLSKLWGNIDTNAFSNLYMDIDNRFEHFHKLTEAGQKLIYNTSLQSGLSKDQSTLVYANLRLIMDVYPNIARYLGMSRSYSGYSLLSQRMESAMVEQLNRIYTDLLSGQKAIEVNTALLQKSLSDDNKTTNQITAAQASIMSAVERLDIEIILGEDLEQSWYDFYLKTQAELDTFWQLASTGFEYSSIELNNRTYNKQFYFGALILGLLAVAMVGAYIFIGFNYSIRENMSAVLKAANRLADGDLTGVAKIQSRDEMNELATQFNEMSQRIHDVIEAVQATSEELQSQSTQLNNTSRSTLSQVQEQNNETENIASAILQMSEAATDVRASITLSSKNAEDAQKQAQNSDKIVQSALNDINSLSSEIDQSMRVINDLAENSAQVYQVLDVIKTIAEQTNLLALNAAIEAARAGDQGRGFAVVADEVRSLAQRTHNSTTEIEQMIHQLQSGVESAVTHMSSSHQKASNTVESSAKISEALHEITESVKNIANISSEVATNTDTQASTIADIQNHISHIRSISESTASGSKTTAQACHRMGEFSEKMQKLVASFKV